MYFSSKIISDFKEFAVSNGMDISQFEKEFPSSIGENYIDYRVVVRLINFLAQELNDNFLGLHIGERISLRVTEYVDSIMQNSTTLEKAFENAVYYSRSISDALDCTLEKNNEKYVVVFEENPNWTVQNDLAKRQILDITLLSCLKSLIAYTGKAYYPLSISLNFTKPKYISEYYRLFNCSLKFNTERAEITFEKQIFNTHKKDIQYGLLRNLEDKITKEIQSLEGENELIYELKKVILKYKPERILLDAAAQKLNMSNRTLQRKLKNLNTSFKTIEYELQLNLAKTYLEENQKDIDEISYLLGFSESSAFIRFFKSLTQKTPIEYKNSKA